MSQEEGLSALDPGTGAAGMAGDRLSEANQAPGRSRCRIVPPGRDSDLEASVTIPQLVAWPHWLLSLAYFIFYKDFFFIFKVFIEFVKTLLLFYVLVYWPQGHVGFQVPNLNAGD